MRVKEKTVEFMIAFFNESFEHKDNIYGYMVSMEASGWRNNLACTLFGFKAIIALQVVSRKYLQYSFTTCFVTFQRDYILHVCFHKTPCLIFTITHFFPS
jgi:hypothetical protein